MTTILEHIPDKQTCKLELVGSVYDAFTEILQLCSYEI